MTRVIVHYLKNNSSFITWKIQESNLFLSAKKFELSKFDYIYIINVCILPTIIRVLYYIQYIRKTCDARIFDPGNIAPLVNTNLLSKKRKKQIE